MAAPEADNKVRNLEEFWRIRGKKEERPENVPWGDSFGGWRLLHFFFEIDQKRCFESPYANSEPLFSISRRGLRLKSSLGLSQSSLDTHPFIPVAASRAADERCSRCFRRNGEKVPTNDRCFLYSS